jgi:phosphoribosylamine--glycine ligase
MNPRARQRKVRHVTICERARAFSPQLADSDTDSGAVRILVIGGGAREHALAWKLRSDPSVTDVLAVPGNPGIARHARLVSADPLDRDAMLSLAKQERIDLTVVGPELPLARGLADTFRAAGFPIVGPSRIAAQLETSKVFAKDFMARHAIPTARYVTCGSLGAARKALSDGGFGYPVVVKADGLAGGKGVVIANDAATADAAIRGAMIERHFGDAGARIVIEEFMQGAEASFFVLSDGRTAVPLTSARDHKRVFDDDQGPNTGGMGAFAPNPLVTPDVERRVMREVVDPVLEGLRREGHEYIGVLYVGLMLTADGPRVVEFNVRLGDPEAQVVLPMVECELAPLLMASATRALEGVHVEFSPRPHVGIVLASRGYPSRAETGAEITGIDAAEEIEGGIVFHAGTALADGRLVSSGGRVLTVVADGSTYEEAIDKAYEAVGKISFDGMHYRHDIGRSANHQITNSPNHQIAP